MHLLLTKSSWIVPSSRRICIDIEMAGPISHEQREIDHSQDNDVELKAALTMPAMMVSCTCSFCSHDDWLSTTDFALRFPESKFLVQADTASAFNSAIAIFFCLIAILLFGWQCRRYNSSCRSYLHHCCDENTKDKKTRHKGSTSSQAILTISPDHDSETTLPIQAT